MDAKSQQKVTQMGFVIIRCDDQPQPRIKIKDSARQDWQTLEKFETKAARDRRFRELLEKPKYIND